MVMNLLDNSPRIVSGKGFFPEGIIPFHCCMIEMSAENCGLMVGFGVGEFTEGHQIYLEGGLGEFA
jgi:hypothetical protein